MIIGLCWSHDLSPDQQQKQADCRSGQAIRRNGQFPVDRRTSGPPGCDLDQVPVTKANEGTLPSAGHLLFLSFSTVTYKKIKSKMNIYHVCFKLIIYFLCPKLML